jgi:hypothetical protein
VCILIMDNMAILLEQCMLRVSYTLMSVILIKIQLNADQKQRAVRKRKLWCRKWLQRRNEGRGMSNMIFKELQVNTFKILLGKVEQAIQRQDTILRESISAKTR